ncbi:MAG: hypothetical protein AAGA83_07835 [Cyanobacteria bacterium P01_F01_bin.116]
MHNFFESLPQFINLRFLLILSPITVAIAWAMLIYGEFTPHNYPWRF